MGRADTLCSARLGRPDPEAVMATKLNLRGTAQNMTVSATQVGKASAETRTGSSVPVSTSAVASEQTKVVNSSNWDIPASRLSPPPAIARAIQVPYCNTSLSDSSTDFGGIGPQVKAFSSTGSALFGVIARAGDAQAAAIDDPFSCAPALATAWVREYPLSVQSSYYVDPRSPSAFAVRQSCVEIGGWEAKYNRQPYFTPGEPAYILHLQMNYTHGSSEALCRVPYPTVEIADDRRAEPLWFFPNGANPVLSYKDPHAFDDTRPSPTSCATLSGAATSTSVQYALGASLSLSADGASSKMRAASALGTTASASFALLAVVGYGLGLLGARRRAAQPAPMAPSAG